MSERPVIATRESRLALWQAEHVRALMRERCALDARLLGMTTRGDESSQARAMGDYRRYNAAKLYKAILDGLEYRGTAFFQSYTTCQPEHAVEIYLVSFRPYTEVFVADFHSSLTDWRRAALPRLQSSSG